MIWRKTNWRRDVPTQPMATSLDSGHGGKSARLKLSRVHYKNGVARRAHMDCQVAPMPHTVPQHAIGYICVCVGLEKNKAGVPYGGGKKRIQNTWGPAHGTLQGRWLHAKTLVRRLSAARPRAVVLGQARRLTPRSFWHAPRMARPVSVTAVQPAQQGACVGKPSAR